MKVRKLWRLICLLWACAIIYLCTRAGITSTDISSASHTHRRELILNQGLPTIFVSVASYRDIHCNETLQFLFGKADQPYRIFVGLVEQSKHIGERCVPAEEWESNVKRKVFSHLDAKGPTFGRYEASTLYSGETYYLQIDAHTGFIQGWDTKLINMLKECPADSKKPVLTHYPKIMEDIEKNDNKDVPVMCKSKFDPGSGMVSFEAPLTTVTKGVKYPVPFIAGGFLFTIGDVIKEVPFDPQLPYLFVGEEILLSARLWTSGYDFYTPDENIAYHIYLRHDEPKIWGDIPYWHCAQQLSNAKAHYLLGMTEVKPAQQFMKDIHMYGMGSVRTVNEFWEYAGVDIKNKTTHSEAKWCPRTRPHHIN